MSPWIVYANGHLEALIVGVTLVAAILPLALAATIEAVTDGTPGRSH